MSRPDQSIRTIVLLTLFALAGAVAAQSEGAAPTAARPDAPAYGQRGPNPVGTRDLVIAGEAPLELTLWYPATNIEGRAEAIAYPYTLKMDTPPGTTATVAGHAIGEAPFALAGGPYPLVILSSGFALGRTSYAWQAEHLASHGFVVLAPEHREHFDPSMTTFWPTVVTRPQEILTVLGYVDEQVAPGGLLDGLVDAQLVAMVGHSSGGYTALATAGARVDTGAMTAHCDAVKAADDPNGWLCDLILPFEADMAELAGLDSVPEGLWPAWSDPRIDAVVTMAGDAYKFGPVGLAEVSVPVMAMGGTLDTGSPYAWGTPLANENVSSTTKAMVSFENAEHMIFGTSCEALPIYAEFGMHQLCSDHVWDMDRAHDLINHYATAFLTAILKGDAEAAAALAPATTGFPGVAYQAEGF